MAMVADAVLVESYLRIARVHNAARADPISCAVIRKDLGAGASGPFFDIVRHQFPL
jgi:hypothetical protein